MKKKVIITETQLRRIVDVIKENDQHATIVKKIADDLIKNYEPAIGSFFDGSEYQHKNLVTKKVDGEQISLKSLKNYITAKNPHVSGEFVEQVISDWYNGTLDTKSYLLSKNVKLT